MGLGLHANESRILLGFHRKLFAAIVQRSLNIWMWFNLDRRFGAGLGFEFEIVLGWKTGINTGTRD